MNKYLKYVVFAPLFLIGCGDKEVATEDSNDYIPTRQVSVASSDEENDDFQYYKMEEIAKHSSPSDCWTIVDTVVADVTEFFGQHPGGDENLAKACGIDATEIFNANAKHDPEGKKRVMEMSIGLYTE